jgi:hypothetical protein
LYLIWDSEKNTIIKDVKEDKVENKEETDVKEEEPVNIAKSAHV